MLVGQTIGPFTIEKELGSGAMGSVYRAKFQKDEKTVLPVAIKIVSLGLLGNEGAMARFEREAAILKQLRHPHIVRLIAVGKYRQTPFIAMEYVDGESMDRTLTRRHKLPWEDVVRYGKQLCEALQHAHDKGIVHRDLKPSNLMITKEGVLKLTDFGIAKDTDVTALTGANSTIGTAAYMSPEQCRGDKTLGPKSDLYSLGVCFYELVTGKKPFVAESTVDMFLKHVNEEVVRPRIHNPELPIWMDNLIMFLLEKNKENRPLDAATVGRMLADIEEKVQSQASVGAEVANARRADRPMGGVPLDAADKEAAKQLQSSEKKKKKKKKRGPNKAKILKAVALGVLFLGIVGFTGYMLYGAFFTTETPAQGYAKVEAAAPAGKVEALEIFLKAHGKTSDPLVDKARTQFQQEKARDTEKALLKIFYGVLKPTDGYDPESFKLMTQAFEAENRGELKLAVDLWKSVLEKQPVADVTKLPAEEEVAKARLGWVATKRLSDIQLLAPQALKKIASEIEQERLNEAYRTVDISKPEGLAMMAVRLENFDDKTKARTVWDTIFKLSERDLDQRVWALIAADRRGKTKEPESKEQDNTARLTRISERLTKAELLLPNINQTDKPAVEKRTMRNLARDIQLLYSDETDGAYKPFVARAGKLLEALAK
ncbi:MAG: serine/threonine protein kinase [Fimbriiglobus sp.]